jgi:hypothetical protein
MRLALKTKKIIARTINTQALKIDPEPQRCLHAVVVVRGLLKTPDHRLACNRRCGAVRLIEVTYLMWG